jgi:hypothetical protein
MLRYVLLLLLLALSGCAINQASFSLRDPELFVSPNGYHKIELSKQIYTFKYEVDSSLRKWVPRPSRSKPIFELDGETESSIPTPLK